MAGNVLSNIRYSQSFDLFAFVCWFLSAFPISRVFRLSGNFALKLGAHESKMLFYKEP